MLEDKVYSVRDMVVVLISAAITFSIGLVLMVATNA